MEINQHNQGRRAISTYKVLYSAIDQLTSTQDERLVQLGKQLQTQLEAFEQSSFHNDNRFKNEFKTAFLKELHSQDKYFSTTPTIQRLIHTVHIRFYSTMFFNPEHLSSLSLFKEHGRPEPAFQNRAQHLK